MIISRTENIMGLKELREERGFSRRKLAERSGVNFRSIQDYEQGHKKISSAKSETVYRLSLALGCSADELLELEIISKKCVETKSEERLQKYHKSLQDMKQKIVEQTIYSEKYHVYGKWILNGKNCFLGFMYEGEFIQIPFQAVFSEKTMPWLLDAAVVELEDRIDYIILNQKYEMKGGTEW